MTVLLEELSQFVSLKQLLLLVKCVELQTLKPSHLVYSIYNIYIINIHTCV